MLCRTSNPGARDFQDLEIGGGRRLYHAVAERVANDWNVHGNCMLVVGATYPAELADIRTRVGALPFLVPGVGAQGGDVVLAVRSGRTPSGGGLVINSSRGILYAGKDEQFAAAARRVATRAPRRDQRGASLRPPRTVTRRALLPATIGALGIVYGDIGTSPLYAFKEALAAAGGRRAATPAVLGVLSLIFWSLLVVVTLKYVVLIAARGQRGRRRHPVAARARAAQPRHRRRLGAARR